jgi:hypothetical protein
MLDVEKSAKVGPGQNAEPTKGLVQAKSCDFCNVLWILAGG